MKPVHLAVVFAGMFAWGGAGVTLAAQAVSPTPTTSSDRALPVPPVSKDLVLLRDLVDRLVVAKQRILTLETQAANVEVGSLRAEVEGRLREALHCSAEQILDWAGLACVVETPKPVAPKQP